MTASNGQVGAAFREGRSLQGGNLASVEYPDNVQALQSYRTPIALRCNGTTFLDSHTYSSTTSHHQAGLSGVQVSFALLARLLGLGWWERVRVIDYAPSPARTEIQHDYGYELAPREKVRKVVGEAWDKRREWVPSVDTREGELPASRIADTGDWATLLRVRETGENILLSVEPWMSRRTEQVWAAVLGGRQYTLEGAFESLRPFQPPYKRQGDLFFQPAGNDWEGTIVQNLSLPPLAASPANHIAARAMFVGAQVFVQGDITHREHGRLRLGREVWWEVKRSRAVRTLSMPMRQWRGGSGRMGAD